MFRMVLFAVIAVFSVTVHAGFNEGFEAYQKRDYATALKEWTIEAMHGDSSSQFNLGTMYESGQGTPQDFNEAVKWYRLAADQGDASAQNHLGGMYRNGRGVPQDYNEALKWRRLAADQGDALAQCRLALHYRLGEGTPQDYKEAAKWYQLAADQGNLEAQFALAVHYESGEGVPQDYAEAAKWFRRAADQGYISAQVTLGLWYEYGRGVLQDFEEAVNWYRLAADQGDAEAQYYLGLMYANGKGLPNSRVMAFALYNVSAAGNYSKAKEAIASREEISSSMTSKEIAAGQSLSREISRPGMLLKALDKYSKHPTVKEKVITATSDLPANKAFSNGSYPSRPAKRSGITSCNTRCNNADCYRTYDDGRKVHFQATQKFNPVSGQFEWDSGSC